MGISAPRPEWPEWGGGRWGKATYAAVQSGYAAIPTYLEDNKAEVKGQSSGRKVICRIRDRSILNKRERRREKEWRAV